MNKEEIIRLINMLYEATQKRKLSWTPIEDKSKGGYITNIGDCDIVVNIYYSPYHDCQVGSVELYNANNIPFLNGEYYENGDLPIYISINQLWMEIEDQRFLISDSKEKIFSNLEKLLETR